MKIERFAIWNLFGEYNIDMKIQENTLLLVGENGSGKSTILNALYYLLTQQWIKLASVPCDKIDIVIDGQKFELKPSALANAVRQGNAGHYQEHSSAPNSRRFRFAVSEREKSHWIQNPDRLFELAIRHGVSVDFATDYLLGSESERPTQLVLPAMKPIHDALEAGMKSQILFLPTYRRIERELEHIFKDIRIERDTRSFHRRSSHTGGYIELVEFGMKDVEHSFKDHAQSLDRTFRLDLNRLTGSYLRDVIRSAYLSNDASYESIRSTDVPLESLIARMGPILPTTERNDLLAVVQRIRQAKEVQATDRVIAHFLSMLVSLHAQQQEREQRVRGLVNVCNRYLQGKRLVFDDFQFELRFELTREDVHVPEGDDKKLSPKNLSSGEKQIVSLFTHMYLNEADSYFVLIDEPELSISVDWQRNFLSDIKNSGLCSGLIAVTHSPFVFDNDLSGFAHSIHEFRSPSRV